MAITINGNGTITGYEPVANGSITAAKLATGVGGKTLQVVQVMKKDVQNVAGTAMADVTNFNPSITPTGTGSKILLDINLQGGGNSGALNVFRSIGGGSYAQLTDYIGDQHPNSSNAIRTTASPGNEASAFATFAIKILDNPTYSSGQAIAYKIQVGSPYHSTYVFNINRMQYLHNSSYDKTVISTFTLTEIAA